MIALARTPANLTNADAGRSSGEESLLAQQLARSTEVLRTREAYGQSPHRAMAVVRSLRQTLARMARGGGSLDSTESDFVIRAPREDETQLWHGRTKLPMDPHVLREVLEDGGVVLVPGQAILADPDLARQVMEESLVQCSLEEFRLRQKKSLLLRNLVDLPAPSAQAS